MSNQSNEKDRRPKSVDDAMRFRLSYVILKSGECVLGVTGQSFGAFTSAAGAAWWLRQFADGIERDGEAQAALKDAT